MRLWRHTHTHIHSSFKMGVVSRTKHKCWNCLNLFKWMLPYQILCPSCSCALASIDSIGMHRNISRLKISSEIYIVVYWLKVSGAMCRLFYIFLIFFSLLFVCLFVDSWSLSTHQSILYVSLCDISGLLVWRICCFTLGINSQAPSLFD